MKLGNAIFKADGSSEFKCLAWSTPAVQYEGLQQTDVECTCSNSRVSRTESKINREEVCESAPVARVRGATITDLKTLIVLPEEVDVAVNYLVTGPGIAYNTKVISTDGKEITIDKKARLSFNGNVDISFWRPVADEGHKSYDTFCSGNRNVDGAKCLCCPLRGRFPRTCEVAGNGIGAEDICTNDFYSIPKATILSGNKIEIENHHLLDGDKVIYSRGVNQSGLGNKISALKETKTYTVKKVDANNIQLKNETNSVVTLSTSENDKGNDEQVLAMEPKLSALISCRKILFDTNIYKYVDGLKRAPHACMCGSTKIDNGDVCLHERFSSKELPICPGQQGEKNDIDRKSVV